MAGVENSISGSCVFSEVGGSTREETHSASLRTQKWLYFNSKHQYMHIGNLLHDSHMLEGYYHKGGLGQHET